MLTESIFLAVLIGILVRGNFTNLAMMPLKVYYIPLIAFTVEWVADLYRHSHILGNGSLAIIQIIIYGLLFFFIIANWDNSALRLIGMGFALNLLVIALNGFSMPVSEVLGVRFGFHKTLSQLTSGEIFGHHVMTAATRLPYLADVIPIPPPYWFPKTISVGDILIDIGLMLLIITAMRGGKKRVC